MPEVDPIDDIAKEANWIALGARLARAMQSFSDYGLRSPEDVLRAVARAQGTHAMSLKKPLAAAEWLARRFPDVYERRPGTLPMSNALQLRTLDAVAPAEVDKIADQVILGLLSRSKIATIIDEARAREPRSTSVRRSPAALTKIFELRVASFLSDHLEQIVGYAPVSLRSGGNCRPSADLLFELPSGQTVAVEAKTSRTNVHERHLLEILGVSLLRERLNCKTFIIGGEGWADSLWRLGLLSDEFNVTNISIGILDLDNDEAPRVADFRFVRNRL